METMDVKVIMEHFFYLTIRGVSALYVLYRIARFIFGKRAKNLWNFLTPKARVKEKEATIQAMPEPDSGQIVGRSQTVYLEKPAEEPAKPIEPAFSEDLERLPAHEEEPDITGSDVDYNTEEGILSEADRFLSFDDPPDDGGISTGMTYEQLSSAMDVIQGKKTDERELHIVARTLVEIQGSDVFNFLTAQAENEQIIEKLMKDYLDTGGEPASGIRKKQKEIEEFDIGKYV